MKHRYYALIIVLNILSTLTAGAVSRNDTKALTDTFYERLAVATTQKDSLRIMCNLFDLLPRDEGTLVGLQMFDVADRANDVSTALETLRNLTNRYIRNDSMLVELYNRTLRYSKLGNEEQYESKLDELRETRTLIKLTRNICQARYSEHEEQRDILMDLLQTTTLNPPTNLYDRIVLGHSICMLLWQIGASDILSHKLDELGDLINQLPPTAISIRNAYNVHAALIYRDNMEYEKSMQADMKTLEGIEILEKHYREIGRVYHSFDANRYIIYTRLLSNFPMLAPHEIEKYYKLAMELAASDYTSAETNEVSPTPQIYYNLAYKNYDKALGYIKSCIDNPYNIQDRRRLLKHEIECAEAIGDKETLLKAACEYYKLLEDNLSQRLDEKYRELQVLSDNSELTNNYNQLQIEKQRAESRALRLTIIIAIAATIILLISVIVLFRLNRRNRSLVVTLDKSNRELREKSENLEQSRQELVKARDIAQKANNLKTDFIKNMSYEVNAPLKAISEYSKLIVDCADASNRKYLERFTSLVELNSELLSTIVNDVLHISEIDSNSVPIHNRSTDLRSLCTMVLDGVRQRLSPQVVLQFDAESPAISLFTDPQRLHQILLNLLTNAAKFTTKGSITLSYRVDEDKETVVFSVTDTGIGIKQDKKDAIFDRFVKLDKDTQGAGLGLTISRMLARIMGGDVQLDTSYVKGARFIVILPQK